MSFSARKSIRLGPIRINLSKSGVGISTGVKGARLSTGPRGTYINLEKNGITYRRKIDGSLRDRSATQTKPRTDARNGTNIPVEDITSTSAADLVDSSNQELLNQINSRLQQPTYALQLRLIATLVAVGLICWLVIAPPNFYPVLYLFGTQVVIQHSTFVVLLIVAIVIFWLMGLGLSSILARRETLKRTTNLRYSLDSGAKDKFIALQRSFALLAKSDQIWQLVAQTSTQDKKRHAGATRMLSRKEVEAGILSPPFLHTGFKVQGLSIGTMQIFFVPDQILVYQDGRYGALSYEDIHISVIPTRFIERDSVPSDSTVVGQTWQYVNKDGGPDKRFSNNRQLPVVQYAELALSSQSGLNLRFHVSNLQNAQQFEPILSGYGRRAEQPRYTSANKTSSGAGYQHSSDSRRNRPYRK